MESDRKFIKTLYFFAFILSTAVLWGCSKKNNLNNQVNGGFGNNGFCQAGQVRTAEGQCLNQFGCPAGQGWNGAACVPGTPVTPGQVFSGAPSAYASSLQITNRNHFEEFLEKIGGVCDFSGFFSFSLFGPDPYDCDTYSDKGYVVMEFYPQGATFNGGGIPAYITIGAGARSPGDGAFGGGFGGVGYITVPLNMTAFPINNNEGFELQAQGGFFSGLSSVISLRTENGNFGVDNNFQVILNYDQQEFSRAFVSRQQ